MQQSRTQLVESEGKIYLVTELDEMPNLDHVETVSGTRDQFYMDWEIADTRKARPQQRRLFFALLNDIADWSVTPQDYLKSLFYLQYQIYTDGKQISLSDVTQSSVSDANVLLELVIDFMFEWRVPFKKGYELLPRDQEYYLFECCRHRVCMICGRRDAQIAHFDAVGNRSRAKVDHRKFRFWCLCPIHHQEQHKIGVESFMKKYHIPPVKLGEETLIKLGVMTQKRVDELDQ